MNWDLCYAAYLNEQALHAVVHQKPFQVFVFTHSPAACSTYCNSGMSDCAQKDQMSNVPVLYHLQHAS
jgi:hypothetical protein